jgi:ribosome maturation factor RimP
VSSQQRGVDASGAGRHSGFGTDIEPVVREAVDSAGFELEDLDVQPAGRRSLVRVVVDADDGVGLDQVADVSRAVSSALDAREDAMGGPYTLEVTSPGVDRPLTRPRHWRRARLRLVTVRTTDGERFTGRTGPADADQGGGVDLLVKGTLRHLDYASIDHAVVEVEFKEPPQDEIDLCGGGIEEEPR